MAGFFFAMLFLAARVAFPFAFAFAVAFALEAPPPPPLPLPAAVPLLFFWIAGQNALVRPPDVLEESTAHESLKDVTAGTLCRSLEFTGCDKGYGIAVEICGSRRFARPAIMKKPLLWKLGGHRFHAASERHHLSQLSSQSLHRLIRQRPCHHLRVQPALVDKLVRDPVPNPRRERLIQKPRLQRRAAP